MKQWTGENYLYNRRRRQRTETETAGDMETPCNESLSPILTEDGRLISEMNQLIIEQLQR